jgi:predicted transcriptional regulator
MLKDLEPSKDYESYIQENIRDLLQLTITLDSHLISAKDIIDFLTKKGPCYYEEMALKFGACLKYDTSSGLPKFLKELCSKGIVEKIKEGMNKPVFFNSFIHEHEKLAQFKSNKYTEKIYQNLADGKPKSTRKISETLSVSFGYANRLLSELKKTQDWLGHEKIRGRSYQDVWFRNDTISASIIELLKEMKENRILERVKFCIKEPKTPQEIGKELGLSEKIVYTSLKKLVETELAFKEKMSNQRNASSNPSVYYLKSDDPLADELHRLKAIFKSTTPKYGEKIYKHFMSHSLSNRRKIMKI